MYHLTICKLHFLVILTLGVFIDTDVDGYASNVLVNTYDGPVDGFSITSHYSAYHKKRINIFLGIPYAKRPTQFTEPKRKFRFQVSHW